MNALNDLYVDGEIAGWIGYYEGKVCTFMFDQESVDQFMKNTKPSGQVRPVFTTPKIPKPWQGLTDEEINDFDKKLRDNGDYCSLHFAWGISAKLKERNT